MSGVGGDAGTPRAVIHKRILDVAGSKPEATIEGIADEISAATPDLVERVLSEYGDPGEQPQEGAAMTQTGEVPDQSGDDPTPTSSNQDESTGEQTEAQPTTDQQVSPEDVTPELTAKQRETARLVHERPDASQGEIADTLGVTRATVSRRLNDIPGFEWTNRRAFTEELFDAPTGTASDVDEADDASDDSQSGGAGDESQADQPEDTALSQFDDRLEALEARVAAAESEQSEGGGQATLPPDLAHKVVHAAMESDRVSEEEELELLKALLR